MSSESQVVWSPNMGRHPTSRKTQQTLGFSIVRFEKLLEKDGHTIQGVELLG